MTDHNKTSTGPMSKKQLIAEMHSEQAAWLALLDEIGEENMTQPEVAGGWSIKDIVAHITGWRRRTVLRFRAVLDPTVDMTAPWPAELNADDEVDEINDWIYKTNRDRPLADVLNDSRDVFQQLVTAIDGLSDEQLNDPQRFPWLEGERLTGALIFGHFHEEHELDMRAWLARVKQTGSQSSSQ
ncbi:MAG TPA: ClbS/DfsB family four-helix bundle protein [Ktedonosporobacter sp.]|nr:ClbS/DfsB family four-helix bundle protein [Ktedonosporobacter sp.]